MPANPINSDTKPWIERVLEAHGDEIVSIERLGETALGFVEKIITSNKTVYCKSGFDTPNETAITASLHQLQPEILPRIIAFDIPNNRLLTEDSGTHLLESKDFDHWIKAVRILSNFHRVTASSLSHLKTSLIFKNLSIEKFLSLIETPELMRYWDIDQQMQSELKSRSSRLDQAFDRVTDTNFELACCHGDAHARNVLVDSDRIVWFDWRDAHIGHPLTDIGWFLVWLLPDRTNLGIGIEITEEKLEILYREYLGSFSAKATDASIRDVMMTAIAHRAAVFHEQFYAHKSIKPYYVQYYLILLLKASLF